MDKAGKGFQREGTVSAKAQKQELGGYQQFPGEEWPARDNQWGGGGVWGAEVVSRALCGAWLSPVR